MSEERLTVAELMARRQQEGKTSDVPRRRRRRSLEEGGISVQELTGSIPRVNAEGPRRGAHAIGSAGEEVDQQVEQENQPLADESSAAPAESPVTDEAVQDAPEALEGHAALEEPAESPAEEPAAEQPTTASLPVVVPMSPRPVMVDSDRSEITYTFTELRDAETGTQTIGEPGPVARSVLDGSNSYDDRPTATIPVVEDVAPAAAQEDPVAAEPAENLEQDAVTAEAEVTDTAAFVAPQEADGVDKPTAVEWGAGLGAAKAAEVESAPEEAPEDALEVAPEETPAVQAADMGRERKAEADAQRDRDYAEDNSLSVPLLMIQVFVGLIVGALIFMGFTFAWQQLPVVVVAIMALVVTGGFAGIANYLRRSKDVATPILAGVVGLALTFGPWLIFQV
nr:hypothetical protein [Corynebacterium lactis]